MYDFRLADVKQDAVELAVNFVEDGGVIALPTDTVYGFACDVQNDEAVKALYQIKIRDLKKPVAICLDKIENISSWGVVTNIPSELFTDLLPGPVTIILERTHLLNPSLNPNTDKVGIRIPCYWLIQEIVNRLGRPLALTSANISNNPSTLVPCEFMPVWPHLSAVFDGGNLEQSSLSRAGSTIVDLSIQGKFKVIREGSALMETTELLLKHGLMPL
ncbi:threonylcarbamoyl-AMP synthase-like [Lycorma delicatula]|uniref:threonylcarbamoyl-AMP synthase-like n=1 Tax=Lycorma delicatula TaxID=130591 RepID=UPI003F50F1E4